MLQQCGGAEIRGIPILLLDPERIRSFLDSSLPFTIEVV